MMNWDDLNRPFSFVRKSKNTDKKLVRFLSVSLMYNLAIANDKTTNKNKIKPNQI